MTEKHRGLRTIAEIRDRIPLIRDNVVELSTRERDSRYSCISVLHVAFNLVVIPAVFLSLFYYTIFLFLVLMLSLVAVGLALFLIDSRMQRQKRKHRHNIANALDEAIEILNSHDGGRHLVNEIDEMLIERAKAHLIPYRRARLEAFTWIASPDVRPGNSDN